MGGENGSNTDWFENFLAGRGMIFYLMTFSFSVQIAERSDLVGGLRKVERVLKSL